MNKQLLVDTLMFQIPKEAINEAINRPDKRFIVKGVVQRADALNQNGRVYPHGILENEANKYKSSYIKEHRAMGELDHPDCFREGAKALTANRGWQLIHEIQEGEDVISLNIKTKKIEIKPVKKVIYEKYSGKMIQINNRNIKTMVTPDHRFLLGNRNNALKYIKAKELYNNSQKYTKSYIPKLGKWDVDYSENFIFPGINKEMLIKRNKSTHTKYKWNEEEINEYSQNLTVNSLFAAFLIGLYLSDGTIDSHNQWMVKQVKKKTINIIKERLEENDILWEYNKRKYFIIKDPRIGMYFDCKFGNSTYTKNIPNEIKNMNSYFLNELIYWFAVGDDRFHKNGRIRNIFSTSKKLIDDLHEILIKSGRSGNRTINETKKDYFFAGHLIKAKNKKALHQLNISSTSSITLNKRFLNISEVDYDGNIVCLSVEDNENFYVMDEGKGFWTGNSSVINLNNVSHNIVDLYWEDKDLMGVIEVLGTPSGNILKELFKAGISLGISSRGLGSVKKEGKDDADYVQEDFELICWDFVSNPSTQGAFMKPLKEGVEHSEEKCGKWCKTSHIISELLPELK